MDNTELKPVVNLESQDDASSGDFEFHESCSNEQKQFFKDSYPDVALVRTEKLHCTSCDKHLGSNTLGSTYIHPLLQVLQCESCLNFYNSGEFQRGEDGSELHCRWCGQGGQVFCCSKCPSVFCKRCVKRNFTRKIMKSILVQDEWECFRCNPQPLWKIQAKCWALNNYIKQEISASMKPEYTDERRQLAHTDFSMCCRTKGSIVPDKNSVKTELNESEENTIVPDNKDTSTSEQITRKRRRSQSKSDKSTTSDDAETKAIIKRSKVCEPEEPLFPMPNQEEDEVVCTPDIFSCFEDNPDDPSPVDEITDITPQSMPNGVNASAKRKPRISVRAPETMMSSPDQPMFPTLVQNRPLIRPVPGSSLLPNPPAAGLHNIPMLAAGSNLIQLNDGRLLSLGNQNVAFPITQSLVTIPHITKTMVPPLVPQTIQAQGPRKPGPNKGALVRSTRGIRYSVPANRSTTTAVASTSHRNSTASTSKNPLADQTLSSLLQKKLQANPNINRVKMRKMPDWFHTNVQSCLVIARTFITQLMDLTSKAQQMQDCTYDEIKNMHVQLSFLISAVIGKYKNNQLDLNLQLSEWTDALCKSVESAPTPEVAPERVMSPVAPLAQFIPVASIVQVAPATMVTSLTTPTHRPGPLVRKEYKEIFARHAHDKKLSMDAVVILHKFRYHKRTNVFKVKAKYKPILRTPAIDPNVIQTIDSESDDDCAIIPDPEPVLIDLDAISENDESAVNGSVDSNNSKTLDKPKSTADEPISITDDSAEITDAETEKAANENNSDSKKNNVVVDKNKEDDTQYCVIKLLDDDEKNEEGPKGKAVNEENSENYKLVTSESKDINEKVSDKAEVIADADIDKSNENEASVMEIPDEALSNENGAISIQIAAVTSLNELVCKGNETVSEVNEATPKENVTNDIKTFSDSNKTVLNDIDTASKDTKAASNETKAVSNETEAVLNETEVVPNENEASTVSNDIEASSSSNETEVASSLIKTESNEKLPVVQENNPVIAEKEVLPEENINQIVPDNGNLTHDLNGDITENMDSEMQEVVSSVSNESPVELQNNISEEQSNFNNTPVPMDVDICEKINNVMDAMDCDNGTENITGTNEAVSTNKNIEFTSNETVNNVNINIDEVVSSTD